MAIEEFLDSSKGYETDANRAVEENRKGDFELLFTNENLPENCMIEYNLKRHDFDFGCNIFMMNQYDTPEENEQYLTLWKKLFNTAVVPLYWEGTEPKKDKLRYDSINGEYIYRRPPAAEVTDYCIKNGITPKGHPLFWHEFIPEWLPKDWKKLYPLIEKRFREISECFADKIPVFDLVNEPSRIWDMTFEHKNDNYIMVTPPNGYLEEIFALGKKYFPNNQLIINDTVGASFCDFRGVYSGYYQLLSRLMNEGMKIDKIGLQCHTNDSPVFKNVFCANRYKSLLETYGELGKETVISEISILSSTSEELQARAAEQLYRQTFADKNASGIFWWNLDDNGIACTKNRNVLGENLPSAGLIRNGKPKMAYRTLENLINNEWHTKGNSAINNRKVSFCGFFGTYEVTVYNEKGFRKSATINFGKQEERTKKIILD